MKLACAVIHPGARRRAAGEGPNFLEFRMERSAHLRPQLSSTLTLLPFGRRESEDRACGAQAL